MGKCALREVTGGETLQAARIRTPPTGDDLVEVAGGIFWARLPLPFRLNHVNIFLFDDDGGWSVFDTGIGDEASRLWWQRMMGQGRLSGRPVRRVFCSHHHPDHAGMVGWLCRTTHAELVMDETEYLMSEYYNSNPGAIDGDVFRRLYLHNGLSNVETEELLGRGHDYRRLTTGLPDTFAHLEAGTPVKVGGRTYEVLSGAGHSINQSMLLCREDGIFLVADQVLPRITPNVGVIGLQPTGNPLQGYLSSLQAIRADTPSEVLALPGHDWPFCNLHGRIGQLLSHHEERFARILEAAQTGDPFTAAQIVPRLFAGVSDLHQRSFAVLETIAHINYLVSTGELAEENRNGIRAFRAATAQIYSG